MPQLFRRLIFKLELPPIRFHNVRHNSITFLMAAGINPKTVAERAGHSKVSMTLDRYAHVTPAMQRQAADTLAAIISA